MSSLPRLYNTLTRRTEPLCLRDPGKAAIYCCGPTVYDMPHAGHARAAIAPDLLVRHLRQKGVVVTYVRNITDIDDKILNRARDNGESPLELSRRMTEVYQEQMRIIGCLEPDREPKVSDHLPQIFTLIEALISQGNAYVVDMPGGTRDVYFSVRSFAGYGKLSRRRIDELLVGARVEKEESKRDPLDFALWKGAPAGEWGWESPWGYGRPGWHIECSAMSTHYLGHGFDVHAGGMDLIFPHHENEIAQSEAACPDKGAMAGLWMHNGFVNVDKEKMSKSLGNFVTVKDVLDRNDPEGFRWFLLTVQYRGPIQFDTETLPEGRVIFPSIDEAERRVDYLYDTLARLESQRGGAGSKASPAVLAQVEAAHKAAAEALEALDDDLNTPVALAAIGEIARIGNELCDAAQKRRKDAQFAGAAASAAAEIFDCLRRSTSVLGLLQASAARYAERTRERRLRLRGLSRAEIETDVARRTEARKNKNFGEADAIRTKLETLGIALHDSATGTGWSIAQ
jgi:cysteinyl-tRNA synthetase